MNPKTPGYSIIPFGPRSTVFMVILSQNPFNRDDRVTNMKEKKIFMLTLKLWRILQSQIDFEKLEEVLW